MVAPGDKAELERLESFDSDSLYIALAEAGTSGAFPLDPKHKIAIGRALFEGWLAKTRADLCRRYRDSARHEHEPETGIRDAAFVFDALLALRGQMPLATFSVLVARHGLDALCAE